MRGMIEVKNHSLTCLFKQVEAVDLDTRPCHHMLGLEMLSHTAFVQSDTLMYYIALLNSTILKQVR